MITYYEELERREKQGLQEGLQQGLQQGLQKGLQQGLQQGLQKGLQEGLQQGLQEGLQQGLQEGLQQGRQQEQIKSLLERFFDDESLKKPLLRIEKNSIPKELVEQVWNNYTQRLPIPNSKTLEDFVQILQNEGILQ
ncbi:MAG: hypothetical protein LBQ03_03100 [Puniceicoccales bacterium]|nr:hypothetical protein [Puniceicoccales bacterium]